MGKVLKDKQKIEKTDDGKKIFRQHFEQELTDEEIQKNKQFLQNNIDALEYYLKNLSADKAKNKKMKELENDYLIKKEAVENFDKYISDIIIDLKRNKGKKLMEFKKDIDNYEKNKEKWKKKLEEDVANQKKQFESQLKDEKEKIKVYEGY